jgi:hypothetical protein
MGRNAAVAPALHSRADAPAGRCVTPRAASRASQCKPAVVPREDRPSRLVGAASFRRRNHSLVTSPGRPPPAPHKRDAAFCAPSTGPPTSLCHRRRHRKRSPPGCRQRCAPACRVTSPPALQSAVGGCRHGRTGVAEG